MSEVDDRIVSMKFENTNFEQKLSATIASLDKLRASLDFANSKKGLDDLSQAGSRFNMGNIGSAIDGVSGKFMAMATVGITALATITSRAVSAGISLVKSLSLDPIMSGFSEYELKMGSIQTILANTARYGTSLEQVNASLDDLNTYADHTIYNFGDMTKNIGLFTNAGLKVEEATSMIKGFSNEAAASGTNAQGAAGAAYQLSQALSAGTIRLMDWRSLSNVGMGNKNMQQGLVDLAEAMGETTKAGVSAKEIMEDFPHSLEKGWLSADVMSKYLKIMSGDMSDAEIAATGLSDAQIQAFKKQQQTAQDAATKVRTFTQLMSTLKEAVGSGWSETFGIVLGNFDEATDLFTKINNKLSDVVGNSAEARNTLLNQWKFVGGREELIQGFENLAKAVGNVIKPIKDAFRDIFPAMTFQQLDDLTQRFQDFTKALIPSQETMEKITRIFQGLFSVVEIGWTVIKELAKFLMELVGSFSGVGGGAVDFIDKLAGMAYQLNNILVTEGGIRKFFEKLRDFIQMPIQYILLLKDKLIEFFTLKYDVGSEISGAVDRVQGRFEGLMAVIDRVKDVAEKVKGVLDKAWGYISTWFKELGQKIADALKPGDFDAAVDVVNVGLLGGIIVMLKKFISGGGIDLGGLNKLSETIGQSFESLTGALKSMQAQIKSKTLLQIAGAVGILTVSVVALSLIDSAALTKALTALTVSFGLLIGAMTALDKINFSTSTSKLGGLAVGMMLLAAAADILAIAVKSLSSLSWEELAKGLLGVTVMLAALTASTNLIASDTSGMIRAGVGMIALSAALLVLSEAVKSFADMSWGEMAKGMAGVAVGLGLIVVAMNMMPTEGMVGAGAGMILIGAGLRVLAIAVQAFADISLGDLAKGFISIGVGLSMIASVMALMPPNLPVTAAGMVILSGALVILSGAVQLMGNIKFSELAKGIGGLAIMLGVLVVAMNLMNGTLGGAAALVVVAGALGVLTVVIAQLGKIPIAQLVTGLVAVAAVLALLGGAALLLEPLIPALLGLGVALGLVGLSFALFGAGAILVAKSFQLMAVAGKAGIAAMIEAIKMFIGALPGFVGAFATSIQKVITDILNSIPLVMKLLTAVLSQLLDTIIELVPKIAEALAAIIDAGVILIRSKFPALLTLGFEMLMQLLQGIRDNISHIVDVGVEIMENFSTGLINNMQKIVDAAVNVITAFLDAIAGRIGDIVAAGFGILTSFLLGISDNIQLVLDTVTLIIEKFLYQVASSIIKIIDAGFSILKALLKGIADNINEVADTVTDIIVKFIDTMAENWTRIMNAGGDALVKFLDGIGNNIQKVADKIGEVVTKIITTVAQKGQDIFDAGTKALTNFLDGLGDDVNAMLKAGVDLVITIMEGAASDAVDFANRAGDVLVKFLNGMATAIRTHNSELRDAGKNIAGAIMDGVTFGLSSKVGDAVGGMVSVGKSVIKSGLSVFGINSPSKVFIGVGESIVEGLAIGISRSRPAENSSERLAKSVISTFQDNLESKVKTPSDFIKAYFDAHPVQPVVKPVLDMSGLTSVQKASPLIDWIMGKGNPYLKLTPDTSLNNATDIAKNGEAIKKATEKYIPDSYAPTEVKFEQNNYSPKELTTAEIYRNTKSLIALTKEKLGV